MNGMNFKTFISKLLDTLSDEEIKTLATLMNSHSDDFKRRSLLKGDLTNADKGVSLCTIQLDAETFRTGYLIFNNTYCVLLGYVSNSPVITEYKITNNTYEVVKEHLTTDYLRHEVQIKAVSVGASISIQADDIESETATKGQVLGADGDGGSEWINVANVFEVSNITSISAAILDLLKPGDMVQKITGNEKHTYIVSYEGTGAGTGICLTYVDGSGYIETVSYDRSGDSWIYNSTDIVTDLDKALKMPNNIDPTKTYTLKIVNGVLTAVEDE